MRELNKNILLILLSTIFSFLIFTVFYEIFANINYFKWKKVYSKQGDLYGNLTIRSLNKKLIWEYRPYGQCTIKRKLYNDKLVGTIETNRYGFRDYDYESTLKPDDVYRIAFIGDSVTLGLWVDFKDTFSKKIELYSRTLNLNKKIESLNFGVDGYNTIQILENLKCKVLKFSPDKVFYVMCLNDFDFYEASGKKTDYFIKPKLFITRKFKKIYEKYSRPKNLDYHLYYFNINKNKVFKKIFEMRNLLENSGIGFQVVILPAFYLNQSEFDDYMLADIHKEIANTLKGNNIAVYDLLEAFKNTSRSPRYYAYDIWHPNVEGHNLIAHALLTLLQNDIKNQDH